jgi:hypothetical protein
MIKATWRPTAVLVGAAAAAAIAVTACGTSTPAQPAHANAAPTVTVTPAAAQPAPVQPSANQSPSCADQYSQWQSSPAPQAITQMGALMGQTSTDASSEDFAATASDLEQMTTPAQTLQQNTLPACVDTNGSYAQLISAIQQASSDASGVDSQDLSALSDATSAIQQIANLAGDLTSEIKTYNGQ